MHVEIDSAEEVLTGGDTLMVLSEATLFMAVTARL